MRGTKVILVAIPNPRTVPMNKALLWSVSPFLSLATGMSSVIKTSAAAIRSGSGVTLGSASGT